MLENSFVKFGGTPVTCNPIPINQMSDLEFYTNYPFVFVGIYDKGRIAVEAVDYDVEDVGGGYKHLKLKGAMPYMDVCFSVVLINSFGVGVDSDHYFLHTTDTTNNTLLKYWSDRLVFGFPYDSDELPNQVRLPIKIHQPQFPQADEIYTDGVGTRHLLTSRVDKEYTLDTDYMSVQMHERLIVALSHKNVYIGGEKLQRSGAYEIDYENEYISDCGEKLYKGSARMIRNTTLLNLNC